MELLVHERVLHGGVDMKIFWLLRMEHVHVWDVYIILRKGFWLCMMLMRY